MAAFCRATGPLAVVDLETSGLIEDRGAEIIEIGAVLFEPDGATIRTVTGLVRPHRPLPLVIERLTGLSDEAFEGAPEIDDIKKLFAGLLAGRVLIAHNTDFERHFLGKYVDSALSRARYLDTLDLFTVTHPDANDLRLESFTRSLLGVEEQHRALDDALDTARIVSKVAEAAYAGERRYAVARRSLERFSPRSLWLAALASAPGLGFVEEFDAPLEPAAGEPGHGVSGASGTNEEDDPFEFVEIGVSTEKPVSFDEDEIAAALADQERGRRHLKGYRVRAEQIRLAREFARNLANQGTLLLEGGTGVGKSFAYLAAAIPFALDPARAQVSREPLIISTRTKLLQDQLLHQDIAAAARFLGYPELRAISIKGRANYLCERRMRDVLADGGDVSLLEEDRMPYAVLLACARTRPHGEVGTLPGAFLFRHPSLRDMLRRSVAARAEQCSREECARNPDCPFGRRRKALSKAHLVVANHDLLLRWPPDYPKFRDVIVDEGHELAGVADEVYATTVRPQDILERVEELFPNEGGRPRRGARGAVGAARWRAELRLDLVALGRSLEGAASEYGEVELAAGAAARFPEAAVLAEIAAARLCEVGDVAVAEERDRTASRSRATGAPGKSGRDSSPDDTTNNGTGSTTSSAASVETESAAAGVSEGPSEVERAAGELRLAALGLRAAFREDEDCETAVASFEGLEHPYDQWSLAIRAVSPADAFHENFLLRLDSVALVSASMFVGGDAFAAIGELEVEERRREGVTKVSVESPFPYSTHMRALALGEGSGGSSDLVEQTALALATTARRLEGRTLGLFTSLRRMNQVAQRLQQLLRGEEIEILAPRRAGDDPRALVGRFVEASASNRGGAVLLGARKFWQGLDIPGDALQAVVIEKLPFDVPTELRRRREQRVRNEGLDAFDRFTLAKMLLHLKQMTGRLIRTESDRGIVVLVEGRVTRPYFGALGRALPVGVEMQAVEMDAFEQALTAALEEIELVPSGR